MTLFDTTTIRMAAAVECAQCGTHFSMQAGLEERRREDGGGFYCPNGHPLSFKESEASKLRRQLKNANDTAKWEREHREAAERKVAAQKGVATKLRKRIVAGACPFGCHRTFTNLARHVASKHPGKALEGES